MDGQAVTMLDDWAGRFAQLALDLMAAGDARAPACGRIAGSLAHLAALRRHHGTPPADVPEPEEGETHG